MIDGVPRAGDEPKRKLFIEAVGIMLTLREISYDGRDQADDKPNHDTLAT